MVLTPQNERFVLHFGEMGSRWGVNRTVGQIYALLFLAPQPLHADDIAETLGFSRSNVSLGLKELQSWRLVKLVHQVGDPRDLVLRSAKPPRADILALGTHGRSGLARALLGSVAESVTRQASIDVLVVPARFRSDARS